MPIYKSERPISIQSFRAYCDICQTGFQPLAELTELKIRRSTKPSHSMSCGEAFESIPEVTEEFLRSELAQAGWKFETFHGKEFILCRGCSQQ